LYGRVEEELKEIQRAIQLICIVPTMPSSLETVELRDEAAQLRRLVDEIEARI